MVHTDVVKLVETFHQPGKRFARGFGKQGDAGVTARKTIFFPDTTDTVGVDDRDETVVSFLCLGRCGDAGPGAVLFVAEKESDGSGRVLVGQQPCYFEKDNDPARIVVRTGRIDPALRILVRQKKDDVCGIGRTRPFGVKVLGGIPGIFQFRSRILRSFGLCLVASERLNLNRLTGHVVAARLEIGLDVSVRLVERAAGFAGPMVVQFSHRQG